MTIELTLTPQDFFAKDRQITKIRPLIATCLRTKGALVAELTSNTVRVHVEPAKQASEAFRIIGLPIMPDLNLDAIDQVGAKLIFPLLFNINIFSLPHRQLFYLGRDFRSIADFFARNLFLAAIRNATFEIQAAQLHQFSDPAKRFIHEYFFILKQAFQEDHLKNRDAKESINLIELNAYLNVQYFSSALLNCNLGHMNAENQHSGFANRLNILKMRILKTRSALLA